MLIGEKVLLQWGNVEERMQGGWERKLRSSSFFYQNMASRARKKRTNPLVHKKEKKEQIPLSVFPLRPSGPAAGTLPSLTSKVLFFILRPLWIISWRQCPRVRPRRHATQRARSEIFKLSLYRAPGRPGASAAHGHGGHWQTRTQPERNGSHWY